MHQTAAQFLLPLSLKDDATFSNFYSGKNEEKILALKLAVSGAGEKLIYLCGVRGQGCSHLLQACCHHAQCANRTSVYLPLANLLSFTPEILNGFETLSLICIDDLQVIAGHKEWEEAIFHLYNRVNDAGGNMIVAAQGLPKSMQLTLPDLISRLASGIIYQLHPLTDEEKLWVLMMRAERRGISLAEEVAKYILTHCPRHMGTLFAALDALDKASLALHRRLTIPFVKEILQI